MEKIQGGG